MLESSKVGTVPFAVGAAVAIAAIGAIGAARAYTIETHFTASCHEKLAAQALRSARAQLQMAATPPATRDEQALIDDLRFAPEGEMRDLAGATLLVALRDNDLKGRLMELYGAPSGSKG